MKRVAHLARRFLGSLSRRTPGAADVAWAESFLLEPERELWRRMPVADRRHSVTVARRFVARRPDASRAEMAGALLHDVGKIAAGLATFGRIAATIAGPRTERFRRYHDHERLGADMLDAVGADVDTVELVRGLGPAVADLRAADDV